MIPQNPLPHMDIVTINTLNQGWDVQEDLLNGLDCSAHVTTAQL